jgi:hypothetical protein
VTLLGAGGLAALRARQLASAAGVGDAGTLTALGHSASTFWAGSCLPLGTGGSAPVADASLVTSSSSSPLSVLGSRAQFGVKGVVSGPLEAGGGRVTAPVAALARSGGGSDRTGLVVALFAASAILGAVLGALDPRHKTDAA